MSLTNEEVIDVWAGELKIPAPGCVFYRSPQELYDNIGAPATSTFSLKASIPEVAYLFDGKNEPSGISDPQQRFVLQTSLANQLQAMQAQNSHVHALNLAATALQANTFSFTNPPSYGTVMLNSQPDLSPSAVIRKYLSSMVLEHPENKKTLLLGFICRNRWHLIRPTLRYLTDDRNRPHAYNGPWIEFEDGQKDYQILGARMDKRFIENWNEISAQEIFELKNQEVQTRLIERYGSEKFMRDMNAIRVLNDDVGVMYQIGTQATRWDTSVIKFVEVINSTPEPDGTYKKYILRVPPDTQTPKAGIAWTFGLTEEEYNPEVQT